MNNATKLFKNAIYSSIAEILGPLISIFLIIYTSRKLGTSGLGEYNTVIIFHLFFEKFAQLGLHDQITRDMASDQSRGESYLNASLLIGVFSSLVVLPFLYIVLAAMHYPEPISQGVKVLSLSLVFFVLTDYQIAFFEGFQRMELKTAVSLVEAISRVSLGILAVYLGYGVLGLLWAVVTARVLVTMLTSC